MGTQGQCGEWGAQRLSTGVGGVGLPGAPSTNGWDFLTPEGAVSGASSGS